MTKPIYSLSVYLAEMKEAGIRRTPEIGSIYQMISIENLSTFSFRISPKFPSSPSIATSMIESEIMRFEHLISFVLILIPNHNRDSFIWFDEPKWRLNTEDFCRCTTDFEGNSFRRWIVHFNENWCGFSVIRTLEFNLGISISKCFSNIDIHSLCLYSVTT